MGYWYNRGQQHSKRPLFEGLCVNQGRCRREGVSCFACCAALCRSIPKAMCGCLLYCGVGIMGNICYGPRRVLISPTHVQPSASWTRVDAHRVTAAHATLLGPPMNRDGKILVSAAGVSETHAQPPCLLRYSPQLWAKELPTMFAHDPETNTLSLQPGRHPPWIRSTIGRRRESRQRHGCTVRSGSFGRKV